MSTETRARLVRVRLPLADTDPWTLLPPLQSDGARLMAWSSPDGVERFVAVGACAEFRPTGPNRFDEARRWWQRFAGDQTRTTNRDGSPAQSSAPVCLAGFAFQTDHARSDAWGAWGDGALCIPDLVLWRGPTGTEATIIADTTQGPVEDTVAEIERRLRDWLARAENAPVNPATAATLVNASEAQQEWVRGVAAAQEQMAKGALKKVVLARSAAFEPGRTEQFDPLGTATALRDRQTRSTTFLIRRRDGQAFLGSSPEILVRIRSGEVSTVALAGTRKRGHGEEDDVLANDLISSVKDLTEHRLVTAAIKEALEPHVTALQIPDSPLVVCHPDVQHLRTDITGQLSPDATIFELVSRLHPTPAVGGLPREQAMDWLDHNEPLDRGWYAGPIGWVSADGDGEFVVAIRSVLMAPRSAAAFAGCGLIADSVPEDEWEESQVKLQTVKQGLSVSSHPSVER